MSKRLTTAGEIDSSFSVVVFFVFDDFLGRFCRLTEPEGADNSGPKIDSSVSIVEFFVFDDLLEHFC